MYLPCHGNSMECISCLDPTICLYSMQRMLDGPAFPTRATTHFVVVEDQARPYTTILIKFAEEVHFDSPLQS
jgi:hypothetical protein